MFRNLKPHESSKRHLVANPLCAFFFEKKKEKKEEKLAWHQHGVFIGGANVRISTQAETQSPRKRKKRK